jgi:hypothetical protein
MRLISRRNRFHVDVDHFPPNDDTFPSFAQSPEWYNLKLLRSPKGLTEPISYEVHRKSVEGMFKALGIQSSVKTHVGRGGGARMGVASGADRESVRAAGRWNGRSVMDSCYLTAIPRDVVRAHAGFNPAGGTYHLPRDLEVPEALLDKVFPKAKEWYVDLRFESLN